MAKWQYTKGLHDLGNGCYAYLLPDGSWGWSNAGLIVDSGQSLLVDTLFDLKLTREMLDSMRRAAPEAEQIGTLVNTHANGDHTFGNQLVKGAQIVASRGCAEDMAERPPEAFAEMMRNWRKLGEAGAFLHEVMGSRFDFAGVVYTPPTRLFDRTLDLRVGRKAVHLANVGPAHTRGDVLAYVPEDRTVFTGDILFVGGHPAVWAGPVSNWIKACDLILSWDVETVVPGHGPITDKSAVRALKHYLDYTLTEAKKRFDAGMTDEEAARDIAWDAFRDWMDGERIFINVNAAYREFKGDASPPDVLRLFTLMARWHNEHRAPDAHGHSHKH
jgi:glyoxylase-like metal-dependent hydrolase (beta-lactamase superfamily II)